MTSDGHRVVYRLNDGSLEVWDLKNGRRLCTHYDKRDTLLLAVTPDGCRAASAFSDGSLTVWDMESGRTLATLDTCLDDAIGWLAITSDGLQVISSLRDGRLKIWDLERGQVIYTFTGHTEGVSVVAVTPDGRRAVSVSINNTGDREEIFKHSWHSWFKDGTLKVWDLESGRELVSYSYHSYFSYLSAISSVAVTPDGRKAISGFGDGTLMVLDLESGRRLRTSTRHSKWISVLAVTQDGRQVVSGSLDGCLKVWDLDSGTIIAEFYGDRSITACSCNNLYGSIIVGDSGGRVYMLWLEGILSDYPVITAMERDGGLMQLKCFSCQQWSDLQRDDVRGEVICPLCGRKMQVNSMILDRNFAHFRSSTIEKQ